MYVIDDKEQINTDKRLRRRSKHEFTLSFLIHPSQVARSKRTRGIKKDWCLRYIYLFIITSYYHNIMFIWNSLKNIYKVHKAFINSAVVL